MKKITLGAIILFCVIVLGIFVLGLFFYRNTPIAAQRQNANSTVASAVFTTQEVAAHSSPSDCYFIVNNRVYDVTSYIDLHPGGRSRITSNCGKEVSKIFAAIHSNVAWNLLKKYEIGTVGSGAVAQVNGASQQLEKLKNSVVQTYPGAEVVSVKPKQNFYVAKIIFRNALYEIHLDERGTVLKEEVENSELDWGAWDTDADDAKVQ